MTHAFEGLEKYQEAIENVRQPPVPQPQDGVQHDGADGGWWWLVEWKLVFYGGCVLQWPTSLLQPSRFLQCLWISPGNQVFNLQAGVNPCSGSHVVMLWVLLEGETNHGKEQLQVLCRSFATGTWGWDDQGHRDTQRDPKPQKTAGGANKGAAERLHIWKWTVVLIAGFQKSMDFGLVHRHGCCCTAWWNKIFVGCANIWPANMKAWWSGCFPVDRLAHPKQVNWKHPPLQFLALICYVRHSCIAWDPGLGLDPHQGCKPVHVSASLVSADVQKVIRLWSIIKIADFTTGKDKAAGWLTRNNPACID